MAETRRWWREENVEAVEVSRRDAVVRDSRHGVGG
jgi:hypothetical protein